MEKSDFIEKAVKIHGNKYDYSKVDYVNYKTKVCIICPEHGEFWQTPNNHLRGSGCKMCGYDKMKAKQRKTAEKFLKEITEMYGDTYDFSKVKYINDQTKICVICHNKDEFGEEHGEFFVTPNNFLKGRKCPKCQKRFKLTKEFFVKKAKTVHEDKYDYSESEIHGVDTKIKIICPEHGEFWQTPYKHLNGQGCPTCGKIKKGISKRNDFSVVKDKFNEVHHFKYDYSQAVYVGVDTKIKIICPEHGEFWQTPYVHLNGCGCPKCNESKLEKEISAFLNEKNINFNYRKRDIKWLNGLELDFYLPDYNIAIECQGIQHFKPTNFGHRDKNSIVNDYERTVERDKKKFKLCEENGVKLLYFSNLNIEYPYKVFVDKEELLNNILNYGFK